MIRFTVFRKDETYKGFLCEGHAEYSEEGMDIVCAAVSALTVNTINSVEKLTEDPFAFEEKEEGGWLKLEFKEEPSGACRLLMDSLVLGMQMISETYGVDFVNVQYSEEV